MSIIAVPQAIRATKARIWVWWLRRRHIIQVSQFCLDDGTSVPVVMFPSGIFGDEGDEEPFDEDDDDATYWEEFDPEDWIGPTVN